MTDPVTALTDSVLEPTADAGSAASRYRTARYRRWSKLFATFLTGQVLIQGLNLVTGFFLLRWMTPAAYGQYSVAFAFQTTLNLLVDLGFSGSIVALVGDRGDQPHVIGEYIRCARFHRNRMFVLLGSLSAVAFPLVTWNQPWGWPVKAGLWSAVVASVFFQSTILYGAPLLIHRRLREYYAAGLVPSILRLLGAATFHVVGALFGWVLAWLNAMVIAVQGTLYRRHARMLIAEPSRHQPETTKEMRHYLSPLWPGLVLYAFQSQIMIGLISIFGQTRNIAEVAALGRLGQLFLLAGAANGVLIEPLIAKTHRRVLPSRFLAVLACCVAMCTVLTLVAFYFPAPLLWLIGPQYASLGPLVGIVVLGSALGYLSGVLFVMNTARKWTFWTTTAVNIIVSLGLQIGWILSGHVSTTQGIILLGVTTSIAALMINGITALAGFYSSRGALCQ